MICRLCEEIMEVFTSDKDDKHIFMCPCCGSIYLPEETRDKRIKEYENYYGNFFPVRGNVPTESQVSYAKFLCGKLYLKNINMYYLSKVEMIEFISYLKSACDVWEEIKRQNKKLKSIKSKEEPEQNSENTNKTCTTAFEEREDVINIDNIIKNKQEELHDLMDNVKEIIEKTKERKMAIQ